MWLWSGLTINYLSVEANNSLLIYSPAGRSARERWKLFKNISRIGLLQQRALPEEDNLSSVSSF